jgi:hypothetical protein
VLWVSLHLASYFFNKERRKEEIMEETKRCLKRGRRKETMRTQRKIREENYVKQANTYMQVYVSVRRYHCPLSEPGECEKR